MYVLTKRKSITAYTWSHCPDKTVAQLWQRDRASSAILRGWVTLSLFEAKF